MVGMMVGQHKPANRLVGHTADRAEELLSLARAGERVDHDHAVRGYDEAGVGTALDSLSAVAEDGVHARRELAQRQLAARVGGAQSQQ
jgi:hypothetical protein